ncbi:ABC transporter permease [Clostridium grantii]|uniref:Lipoprotein-releasing system permease protein n=1 Tax=Clostridium grantii DSM 8605 TaxID=1121316 RepID=A0A1M5VC52_9CLOT|nr:ABC transporter permease [Clostridium grantii]SHH72820.1 lipoprotein-releasing system permease protein [Clostridium grantii DSM 8605]
MKLPLKIAIRFLGSSKGQTTLIALGIAVGVSVQVFIGSLIFGLQKSLVNTTIGSSSQITIISTEDYIEDYEDKVSKASTLDEAIVKISEALDSPAFISFNDKENSILFRGLNINESDKIYNIKDRLVEGKLPDTDNEVIIGQALKEELNIALGDEVEIITTKGQKSNVKVVGIFDLKVAAINSSWLISNINTAQSIFDLKGKITSIEMQVAENKEFNVRLIAENVEKSLNDDSLEVNNWMDQNEQLLSGLNGQSASSYMIQFFVIISVVLGISSVLAISVVQRSKQIGILKAMGIKDSDSSKIFLYQGIILGIFGAILGIILGLVLMFAFSKFALNPDGTPVVPLYIDYKFIAFSALIAIVASTLAALVPAVRSSKLNPIEVIKNG